MADRPNPAYDGDEPYIFVSFSHADEALVYPEIRWLQDQGFNVWFDEGISGGSRWRDAIAGHLSGCHLLLFFVTPKSVESQVCREELEFVLDLGRPVLSVHLEQTDLPDGIRLAIANRQALFREELEPEDYGRKLVSAVATYLDQPIPQVATLRTRTGSRFKVPLASLVALIIAGCLGSLATWYQLRGPEPDQIALTTGYPKGITSNSWSPISPDGKILVYFGVNRETGRRSLYAHRLAELDAFPIPGTESDSEQYFVGHIFFSPDSKWIGYHDNDGAFMKVEVDVGSPETIHRGRGDFTPRFGTWGSNDTIVIDDGDRLASVPAGGGEPSQLTHPGEGEWHRYPSFIPGSNAVVFSLFADAQFEEPMVAVLSLDDGKVTRLTPGSWPRVTSHDQLLYFRDESLWAVRFDRNKLSIRGDPVRVVEDLAGASEGVIGYSTSDNGTLAYWSRRGTSLNRAATWVDRDGNSELLSDELGQIEFPRISPDGARVAFNTRDTLEVFVYDIATGWARQITDGDPGPEAHDDWFGAIWETDGGRLAYSYSPTDMVAGMFATKNDGSDISQLTNTGFEKYLHNASSWVGDTLLYDHCWTAFDCGIGLLKVSGDTQPQLILDSNASDGELSPSGKWMIYQRFGPPVVFFRQVHGEGLGIPITPSGSSCAAWGKGADEVFYVNYPEGKMMSVSIDTSTVPPTLGAPKALFDIGDYLPCSGLGRNYDVHPLDGRFLMLAPMVRSQTRTVVRTNWLHHVDRLL